VGREERKRKMAESSQTGISFRSLSAICSGLALLQGGGGGGRGRCEIKFSACLIKHYGMKKNGAEEPDLCILNPDTSLEASGQLHGLATLFLVKLSVLTG
jgi:hypothetical protein